MSRLKKYAALAAATFSILTTNAWSHHADSMFDKSKTVAITGSVKTWQFMAPHSWLYVITTTPDGKDVLWGFEGGGPSVLLGNLKKDSFKTGEKITVKGYPMKDGRAAAMMSEITFSDGRVMKMGGFAPPAEPNATR